MVANNPPKINVNGMELELSPENEKNKLLNIPDKRNKTRNSSISIFLKKLTTYLVYDLVSITNLSILKTYNFTKIRCYKHLINEIYKIDFLKF